MPKDKDVIISFMISIQDIEKLAELARIRIPEEEKPGLVQEIDSILGYVEQIKNVTDGQPRKVSTPRGEDRLKNVMREDDNPHESGVYTEKILQEAPKREGNYLRVKKIL